MHLSRRELLIGSASALALAACGSSGSSGTSKAAAGHRGLVNTFDPAQPVGRPLRLPLGVTEADGSFASDIPSSLTVRLRKPDGSISSPLTLPRHQEGLPRGYYALPATFDVPGRWTIDALLDGRHVTVDVDAKAASDVAVVPGPGDALPKVPSPTTAEHRGVDPICTRDPVCPFHAVSLDQAIGGTKAIALLVSTPAFCQVAICGPVLDLVVRRKAALEAAGVQVIHAEVYVDDKAKTTAPVVDALGMTYEPALFLARADGTVVERLDYIFDASELDAGMRKLS